MTQTENDRSVTVIATTDGQAVFAYDFQAFAATHVSAIYEDVATGTRQDLVSGSDFSVQNVGNANGGTITLLTLGPSVSIGDKFTIFGAVPVARTADYQPAGDFFAETVNQEQDIQTQIMQELRRDISRSISFPAGESLPNTIPPVADRSGKLLGFDDAGFPLAYDQTPGIYATFSTRQAFQNAAPDVPDGGVIAADGILYVAESGATRIPDLLGFIPFATPRPQHYGAVSNQDGDTSLFNNTNALRVWLSDIAGDQGFLPLGIYAFTDKLTFHPYTAIIGAGKGEWVFSNVTNDGKKTMNSGAILLYTANKSGVGDENLIGITDNRTAGGRFANDASLDANDGTYSLTSFYNDDADVGTGAAATPRNLSVAVKMSAGVKAEGFRVMLSFDGTTSTDGFHPTYTIADGYTDIPSGLGSSSCDIGVLVQRPDNTLIDVDVIGYWRVAGLAQVFAEGNLGNDTTPEGYQEFRQQNTERLRVERCLIQGQVSHLCRGADYHKVLARTSSTIDVEWADNHPFDVTLLRGQFRGGGVVGATGMEFTGVQYVAGTPARLRLTGVTPDPTTVSGVDPANPESVISPITTTIAVAGTRFKDCVLTGMNHGSLERITQAPGVTNPNPSSCAELSGHALRDVSYDGTRFSGPDDIAIFGHNASTIALIGQTTIETTIPRTEQTRGMRLLASPFPTANTRVSNPAGFTTFVNIQGTFAFGQVDLRPQWPMETFSDQNRFSGNGFFEPQRSFVRQAVTPDSNNLSNKFSGPAGGRAAIGTDDGGVGFQYDAATGRSILRGGLPGAPVTYFQADPDGAYAPQGIKFGGTSTGHNLDYYREGTWTPVLSDGTNNATASTAFATYTRIGRKVSGTIRIVLSSKGSISGSLRITGFPFPAINSSAGQGGGYRTQQVNTNFVSGRPPLLRTNQNSTYAFLVKDNGSGGMASVNDADLNDTSELQFRYSYDV